MAHLKQKRINFFMSSAQFKEMEEIISPNEITQSDFIRKAIEERIEKAKKEQLEKELEEGYKAKAKLNLKICEDFKYVDEENI